MRNPLDFWRGPYQPSRDWNQFNRLMENMFNDFGWPAAKAVDGKQLGFVPPCEVTEDKNGYLLKFDLPGLSKDQVRIELHENQLTVSGERKEEKKEEGKRYHFTETSYGSFTRTFTLPANVDPEKVEAKFENGVLTVGVAKSEPAKARQVNIK